MTASGQPICECDLRYRAWNPNTGRCQTCGTRFVDRRDGQPQVSDRRLMSAEKESS
jgi:hypothetical protein